MTQKYRKHISCRISEPKKAHQFFLAPKTSQFFLATCLQSKFFLATCQQSQIFLATFFLQRACGANFLCNAYVAKQLTGIAKLYGMMKLFNISVTKQHRNNGNLIQNPLEKEVGIALFILKKK